jgi:hypothetical protein
MEMDMKATETTGASTDALAQMQRWLERAVIGLNLCPFAKAVHNKGQIRWALSPAETPEALLADLQRELLHLAACPSEHTDTTVLVHPQVLGDFLDYNDFLDVADALLEELGLAGTLQIASFHPHYQFAGTRADDPQNHSNHSPYPCLHLLREESVERAVQAFPDAAQIYERNMQTLQRLGHAGWVALMEEPPPL